MTRFAGIRAVSFDVGGTLIRPWPSVGEVYAGAAARAGIPGLPTDLLTRRFQTAWRSRAAFGYSRNDWACLVDRVFDGLVPEPPSRTFFGALYDAFGRAAAWRVHPDVQPAFEALAMGGCDLAIVSNWDERLRPLLVELGLARFLSCQVISCEVGFQKPSTVMFESAARLLGVPPGSILHVGDSLEEDFGGAVAAGLKAVHLCRDAAAGDGQIGSLADVPILIGAAGRTGFDRRPAPGE